ncbi:MAG TPA: apolipoprotein N-acyltransferase [Burkholderiales bacterium]|nr:apolipoprotein N-acyltransferase [Burkholderiales bacterium]
MNRLTASTSVWDRPWFWVPAASLSCGALVAIPGLFPKLYLLGWITFVPFLLGLQRCRSVRQAYGFGLLTGLVTFSLGTHWMTEFIRIYKTYSFVHSVSLASLYWFYCAQQFAIIAVLTHYGRRGNAMLWVFPTALALVLALYPAPFPWQIGTSQSEFLVALQATDITGVIGLDFVLGIVAVLIAQSLIGRQVFFQRSVLAAYGLVAMWFVYGVFSLAYWDRSAAAWETLKVGLVQSDEPPTIGTPGPRPSFSLGYPIEMNLTEQLVRAGAALVIWPELRNKQYYTQPFIRAAYQRQVAKLATPLLIQAEEEEGALNFNTAVLIDKTGKENGKYRKIRRIALAEYLPLFEHSATAKAWARRYLGEFFGNYSAGREPKSFDIGNAGIQPFICYEVMFPHFVATSAKAAGGDIFVAQSNNGWFGDSRVPYPHMSGSVLRSVENRRPLVHVMNNGLGGVSLPSGRVLLRTTHHEIAGYLLDVPYRKHGATTVYSRFPYLFTALLGLGWALIVVRARRSA